MSHTVLLAVPVDWNCAQKLCPRLAAHGQLLLAHTAAADTVCNPHLSPEGPHFLEDADFALASQPKIATGLFLGQQAN